MIKHYPFLNTAWICEHYTKKDHVPISYVCTSALNDGTQAVDIFYRSTPHPTFGNRYFGLYQLPMNQNVYICNADIVETLRFDLVLDQDDNLQYSQHRWDFRTFENGNMIDGGRAYTRSNGQLHAYVVKDGQMIKLEQN